MIPLFSRTSLIVLESLSFTKTLYAFDFDGTLAPIVSEPASAKMTEVTHDLLKQFSNLVPVAIISGRSIQDLKSRISFQPKFLIGNHGMETTGGADSSLEKAQEICSKWMSKLNQISFEYGVSLEDKKYSIAIHYRNSRSKSLAKADIKNAIHSLTPTPHLILGKSVFNLVPVGAPHKGSALLNLLKTSNLKHAFYIGDDDTDEDIFSLPYQNGQIFTVRVGEKKKSQASYYIKRQSEINKLIRLLIKQHQPSKKIK